MRRAERIDAGVARTGVAVERPGTADRIRRLPIGAVGDEDVRDGKVETVAVRIGVDYERFGAVD